ncbi:MAG TPA: right-handed parallel beta-helix repeat-containing protein, partial [Anaerolineales bacterium]|nr:right-handed parallel beta-helix repeat-containing protein [Anaerolineales bacterium]
MVFPLPVLADGSPTEEPTVTEEVISSQGETPLGEEPINSTPIPTENTPEVIPTEIVSEPTAAPEEPAEDVTEVVQAMNDAGVILADGDGNPIPLASQTAADALSAPDPMGCPPGVQPVSWGGTGIGCTISYASIQAAIDDASVIAGWTIYIDPGAFDENVTVNKSVTLQGSGAGVTIIRPGASSTLDLGCGVGSCASNTNTILYITADNVTILDLTVDGDNTLINSGTVVNGADLNARNGIYGNAVDNLTIEDTTVQNIYLRGIQVSNSNNFVINNNTVSNVDGSSASIAIFNWSSSGSITNNQVTQVNDGIAANYSQGMQVLNNTVSDMNTGIHTDNSGGADTISGNTISNGRANSYGVFVFAPYEPISVTNNTISGVATGLTLAGNGWGDSLNTVTFSDNQVAVSAGGVGAYVTTDVWGFFFSDASAVFNDNVISGGDYGFYFESNGAGEDYSSHDCSGAGG